MIVKYGSMFEKVGSMIVECWSMLFFVRGGYVNPSQTDKFRVAGQWGDYWSSRADSVTSYAYYLYFNDSYVSPSNTYNRYAGNSLRCLIPTT